MFGKLNELVNYYVKFEFRDLGQSNKNMSIVYVT